MPCLVRLVVIVLAVTGMAAADIRGEFALELIRTGGAWRSVHALETVGEIPIHLVIDAKVVAEGNLDGVLLLPFQAQCWREAEASIGFIDPLLGKTFKASQHRNHGVITPNQSHKVLHDSFDFEGRVEIQRKDGWSFIFMGGKLASIGKDGLQIAKVSADDNGKCQILRQAADPLVVERTPRGIMGLGGDLLQFDGKRNLKVTRGASKGLQVSIDDSVITYSHGDGVPGAGWISPFLMSANVAVSLSVGVDTKTGTMASFHWGEVVCDKMSVLSGEKSGVFESLTYERPGEVIEWKFQGQSALVKLINGRAVQETTFSTAVGESFGHVMAVKKWDPWQSKEDGRFARFFPDATGRIIRIESSEYEAIITEISDETGKYHEVKLNGRTIEHVGSLENFATYVTADGHLILVINGSSGQRVRTITYQGAVL